MDLIKLIRIAKAQDLKNSDVYYVHSGDVLINKNNIACVKEDV